MKPFKLYLLSLLIPVCSFGQGLITIFAGTGNEGYNGDGILAKDAQLQHYIGKVIIDYQGNIFFADVNRIRKIDKGTGLISTICGDGTPASTGDGGLAINAQIDSTYYLAINSAGDIFLSESGKPTVRRIERSTGIITTYAGNGAIGYSGDGGQAQNAELGETYGLAMDQNANLYISNEGRIRKVAANGIITTITGNGTVGYSGDGGPALSAEINFGAVCVDLQGNVYMLNYYPPNNYRKIRKVNAGTGIIEHYAGGGATLGEGGPAAIAALGYASDVAADRYGNIFVNNYLGNRIRKIDVSGIITTPAGGGNDFAENMAADTAYVGYPQGVSVDSCGNLYITVVAAILKVTYDDCYPLSIIRSFPDAELSIYPNPASSELNITSNMAIGNVVVTDVMGRIVLERIVNSEEMKIDVSAFASGVYFLRLGDKVVKFVRE